MMIMTESFERTFEHYNFLLKNTNLKIISKIKLNQLQSILISTKL